MTDKLRCEKDEIFISATFDLQSVLQIPLSEVSLMYYSRKLCAYNLTIYESKIPNNAYCYLWSEINANEAAVRLEQHYLNGFLLFQEILPEYPYFPKHAVGKIGTSILLLFSSMPFSYIEADSIHSAIENAKKYVPIYTMHNWINVIKLARSTRSNKKCKPYKVTELLYSDIKKLKILAQSIIRNRKMNTNGEKVEWLKIKCMRFEKEKSYHILYKYNHNKEFKILKVSKDTRQDVMPSNLKNLYKSKLAISVQKKRDLLVIKLCEKELFKKFFIHGAKTYSKKKM